MPFAVFGALCAWKLSFKSCIVVTPVRLISLTPRSVFVEGVLRGLTGLQACKREEDGEEDGAKCRD